MIPAPVINVSQHAVDRYLERIGAASEDAARAALRCNAVVIAAQFGARSVRLPNARIILSLVSNGAVVTTVVPLDHLPAQLLPVSRGGPPPVSADRSWPAQGDFHG